MHGHQVRHQQARRRARSSSDATPVAASAAARHEQPHASSSGSRSSAACSSSRLRYGDRRIPSILAEGYAGPRARRRTGPHDSPRPHDVPGRPEKVYGICFTLEAYPATKSVHGELDRYVRPPWPSRARVPKADADDATKAKSRSGQAATDEIVNAVADDHAIAEPGPRRARRPVRHDRSDPRRPALRPGRLPAGQARPVPEGHGPEEEDHRPRGGIRRRRTGRSRAC